MKVNSKVKVLRKISEIEPGECFKALGTAAYESNLFMKLSFEGTNNCDTDVRYCYGAKLCSGNVWSFKSDTEVLPVNSEVSVNE